MLPYLLLVSHSPLSCSFFYFSFVCLFYSFSFPVHHFYTSLFSFPFFSLPIIYCQMLKPSRYAASAYSTFSTYRSCCSPSSLLIINLAPSPRRSSSLSLPSFFPLASYLDCLLFFISFCLFLFPPSHLSYSLDHSLFLKPPFLAFLPASLTSTLVFVGYLYVYISLA